MPYDTQESDMGAQARSVLDPDDMELHRALQQMIARRMSARLEVTKRMQARTQAVNESMRRGG